MSPVSWANAMPPVPGLPTMQALQQLVNQAVMQALGAQQGGFVPPPGPGLCPSRAPAQAPTGARAAGPGLYAFGTMGLEAKQGMPPAGLIHSTPTGLSATVPPSRGMVPATSPGLGHGLDRASQPSLAPASGWHARPGLPPLGVSVATGQGVPRPQVPLRGPGSGVGPQPVSVSSQSCLSTNRVGVESSTGPLPREKPLPYSELLWHGTHLLREDFLLHRQSLAPDSYQQVAGQSSQSTVFSLKVDQGRLATLDKQFRRPVAAPKLDAATSRFKMDPEVYGALFLAPPINTSVSKLFASYRGNMPPAAVEQLLKQALGLFEGFMASSPGISRCLYGPVFARANAVP